MKLTIKTLQKAAFKIDIELDKTVKDLKNAIEREQGKEYPVDSQKLIYNGKILTDESKLAEYEFDEKKFVVLMITRPPPVSKVGTEQSSSTSTSSSEKNSEVKSMQTKQPDVANAPVAANPASSTTSSTVSSDTAPTQPRIELRTPQQASSDARGAAAAALADLSSLSMGEPQIAARLAQLMSHPQFRQMQDLIQQSPHLLSSTIESLAASDPEMYNFMTDNPDMFVTALNHPPIAGLRTSDTSAQTRPGGGAALPQLGGGGLEVLGQQPASEQVLVNVNERDREAIERLKELGFPELLAVQAYMACDKDENLAANLLFQMDQ